MNDATTDAVEFTYKGQRYVRVDIKPHRRANGTMTRFRGVVIELPDMRRDLHLHGVAPPQAARAEPALPEAQLRPPKRAYPNPAVTPPNRNRNVTVTR
jgi:hypothetical protein